MKQIILIILLLSLTIFAQNENKQATNNLISETSVGDVKLGMTVGEARKVLSESYKFGEAGGDEGIVFLGIYDGEKLLMEIGEYYDSREKDKAPSVNEKQLIESITIHDSRYKTTDGIYAGMPIAEAENKYGKIKKMNNIPHSGETGEFVNQPKYLNFVFGIKGDFYSAGIYEEIPDCKEDYPPLCSVATKYNPGAFVSTISIRGDEYSNEMSENTDESSSKINKGSENFDVMQIKAVCEDGNDLGIPTFVFSKKGENKEFQRIKIESYEKPCSEKLQQPEPISNDEAIFGDYNFDDMEDVAFFEGNIGGYGSPSYQVYLFSKKANKFVRSAAFSKLAQHQGMFEVKKNKQMLYVYSKDGCCFHQIEGYKIINNKPVKIYENTADGSTPSASGAYDPIVTTKKLINGKWRRWGRNSAVPITFDKGKTSKTISINLTTAQPIKWFKLRAAKGQTLMATADAPDAEINIIDAALKNRDEDDFYEIAQEGQSLVAKLNDSTDYYLEVSAEKNLTSNLTITVMNEGDSRTNSLITPQSVGKIKLGMTIAEARRVLPKDLKFSRTMGGYRDLMIGVSQGGREIMKINAGEGEVSDTGTEIPINDNLKIVGIEILDSRFKTAEGVYVGMPIDNVEKKFGKIKSIQWDDEIGEFGIFSNQPSNYDFSLKGPSSKNDANGRYDVAGIYRKDGYKANQYKPKSYIYSISVSQK